ncbi:hypothetical protein GCM10027515_30140 [Schumannella luteola]|uniref:Lipoprotein n=1 Tax=Schumannella luteola TaxID=472059 RepID=A0A852YPQ7_9MICO|nr:hypothetical protein [Schumannella luteola]NYG99185.1 hypothetical protein [Schumannella luteola]TPW90541.1 hypothetical protein FJ656_36950 [Schumannella luteola]
MTIRTSLTPSARHLGLAAAAVTAALLLSACSTSTADSTEKTKAGSAESARPSASPTPEKPADLVGTWKQSNSSSPDTYQEATITADAIEINWVSDGGDTKSLYWAGTFSAPTAAGKYTWTSANDTAKTDSAILASSDPTKDFTFEGDEISYSVSALGTTTTVRLTRVG